MSITIGGDNPNDITIDNILVKEVTIDGIVVWTPTPPNLYVGLDDGTLKKYDIEGNEKWSSKYHTDKINDIDVHEFYNYVITCSDDGYIQRYIADSGSFPATREYNYGSAINTLAYDGGGFELIFGTEDGHIVRLYDDYTVDEDIDVGSEVNDLRRTESGLLVAGLESGELKKYDSYMNNDWTKTFTYPVRSVIVLPSEGEYVSADYILVGLSNGDTKLLSTDGTVLSTAYESLESVGLTADWNYIYHLLIDDDFDNTNNLHRYYSIREDEGIYSSSISSDYTEYESITVDRYGNISLGSPLSTKDIQVVDIASGSFSSVRTISQTNVTALQAGPGRPENGAWGY